MVLQGKIIAVLEPRSGESARGPWKAQDFVIETHDAYPKKMVFSVFGADRLERFNIQTGQEVSVSFDIDAHEYNGRWFNSIRAFDVRPAAQAVQQQAQPSSYVPGGSSAIPNTTFGATPAASADSQFNDTKDDADDLPF